ncbi:prepilin-type N-terminal cleavage/methylation domain-containing protein [Neobacillus niacini]|uniref:prepilin-type N-terminal cleavage/methylation domain-containing protein n=1 Tax=Neobacillus niacini TaxID=86668 RepID=UPI002FFF2E34
MEILKNEKGVTLLEVLLAMAILSIVLISFMNMFPQMGMMNKKNEEKTQAINTAKEILIDWQESVKVKEFITRSDRTVGFTPNNVTDKTYYTSFNPNLTGTDYIFGTVKGIYSVTIKIKKTARTRETSKAYKIHLIEIQLLNDKGNAVSKTYGYIKR